MATVRVFLFTYKRVHLLKRAVNSLINQTYKDWICEVHNDCPDDKDPEHYIHSLNDPRFIVVNHTKNLGMNSSFNLAFDVFDEKYGSILEDDNSWEPEFLQVMVGILEYNADIHIAWSNMNLWQELPGNNWSNTQKAIWDIQKDTKFEFGHINQAMSAIHSNGAMLYKSEYALNYKIPENSLSDAIELIRERTFHYPLYFVARPLANFSITLNSSRSNKPWEWTGIQSMLLASFILTDTNPKEKYKYLLNHYKKLNPKSSLTFILSNLFYIKDKNLYSLFKISDWINFLKWSIRYLIKCQQYINTRNNVYQFVMDNTKKNFNKN